MKFITPAEKAEFISRCKKLAERDGTRIKYYPARFKLVAIGLWLQWCPDEDFLHVRIQLADRKPVNEVWSEVVESFKGQAKWSYRHDIRYHLRLMRGLMVLNDLADV